jgi:outer membrane protein
LVSRSLFSLCIAVYFLASPLTGQSAEMAEKKLSLANCIEIALKNATSAKKAEYSLKLQGADVLRSYGSFLPRLSVSASYIPYNLSRTYTTNSQDNLAASPFKIKTENESVSFTLTTSLNLFNGFHDYASLQSSLDNKQAASHTLSRALENVAFDVTQAYYQVLLNRELLDISRENLLAAQDQLTLTDRQFQVGLKSMIDRYQQQADTAESGQSVIKAENRWQQSKLELLRRLQIDPGTKIALEPSPDELKTVAFVTPDIDSLATVALNRRNDLKSKELETRGAKWQITEARAQWYPALNLNFNASTAGTEYMRQTYNGLPREYSYPSLSDQLGNSIGYSVALNMSWTVFDGFQTRYNVQSAKINQMNKSLDVADLKRNIVIDLQQAAGEYTSAFRQIETARISLKAAHSAFEGIKKKYELGAASFIELSTARATLFNARSTLSQANYNLALQKNVLDFTTGNRPLP